MHKYENNSLPDYFNIFFIETYQHYKACSVAKVAKGKLEPPHFSSDQSQKPTTLQGTD